MTISKPEKGPSGAASRGRPRRRVRLLAPLAALVLTLCLSASACGGAPSGTPPASATATGASAASPRTTPSAHTSRSATASTSTKPSATVVFVDVGQGDAIIVKSGSWTGLIDGGPSGSGPALSSALRRLGVTRLNAVVITHPHADHTNGIAEIAGSYRPQRAYIGLGAGKAKGPLQNAGTRIVSVRRGQTLSFGKLKAKVLSPAQLSGDPNGDSVVLLLDTNGRRLLFTGDCTGPDESAVGETCSRGPPLYLLKVAHHGSRYSTSAGFLAQARPQFAVICVGHNSYGHPSSRVVGDLIGRGTRSYTTLFNGTITLTIAPSGAAKWSFTASSKALTRSQSAGKGGRSSSRQSAPGGALFVTATGECYHRGSCRTIAASTTKRRISLRDARAQGYHPCRVCDPPQ